MKLYSSQLDLWHDVNQLGETQYSDALGKVRFTKLSNIKYYWLAEKGCQNNMNGGVTTLHPLVKAQDTALNIILSSTGTLELISESSNPYRIFINGEEVLEVDGRDTEYRFYMPTGSYSIRVLQKSGYLIYPTDKTYTGTIACSETLTVTFP